MRTHSINQGKASEGIATSEPQATVAHDALSLPDYSSKCVTTPQGLNCYGKSLFLDKLAASSQALCWLTKMLSTNTFFGCLSSISFGVQGVRSPTFCTLGLRYLKTVFEVSFSVLLFITFLSQPAVGMTRLAVCLVGSSVYPLTRFHVLGGQSRKKVRSTSSKLSMRLEAISSSRVTVLLPTILLYRICLSR